MEKEKKGFAYSVEREKIEVYLQWPIKRRIQWLLMGNKMRAFFPTKTIELQDAFREGKI